MTEKKRVQFTFDETTLESVVDAHGFKYDELSVKNPATGEERILMIPRLDDVPEFIHGRTCYKAPHTGTGYLHDELDDTPYDVDGVKYCGRCHHCLP